MELTQPRVAKVFEHAAWDVKLLTKDAPPEDCLTFYLRVFEAGRLFVLHLDKSCIPNLRSMATQSATSYEEQCTRLGVLLDDISSGKQALDDATRKTLAVYCVLYMVGTQEYTDAAKLEIPFNQFLVMYHRAATDNHPFLRPAIITRQEVQSSTQLLDAINDIYTMDCAKHPELYPRTKTNVFPPPTITKV
jgi:hypothetical protein